MSHPVPLARVAPALAAKLLGKKGLAFGGLVADWTAIVGEQAAQMALPDKLAFPRGERRDATLTLRVRGARATELQHMTPAILERVNAWFGYDAVAKLKLVQAPPPPPPKRPAFVRRPLGAAATKALRAEIAGIESPDLRAALERLGAAMRERG